MNQNLKSNERQLIKIATFFKKHSRKLMEEGKLGEEHKAVGDTVDRFIEQMELHADTRAAVFAHREQLSKLVKDNPVCPRCHTNDKLKHAGTEKNDKGWASNRYRCRKCNITFTWNRPNNPWDMISFINEMIAVLILKSNGKDVTESEKQETDQLVQSMQINVNALQSAISGHDVEYKSIIDKDNEMEKLIHEFKNMLLIEKIKMDTWENKSDKRT
jgi:hypothetical protein